MHMLQITDGDLFALLGDVCSRNMCQFIRAVADYIGHSLSVAHHCSYGWHLHHIQDNPGQPEPRSIYGG